MKNHIARPPGIAILGFFLLWSGVSTAEGQISRPSPSIRQPSVADSSEFVLKGMARNGDTGENFDHIYVDVYKIRANGDVELIRADRYPGGKFEIWLRTHDRYMLMLNYDNRAFLQGLLNPADAPIRDGVLSQVFILDEYRPEESAAGQVETPVEAPPTIVSEADLMDKATDGVSADFPEEDEFEEESENADDERGASPGKDLSTCEEKEKKAFAPAERSHAPDAGVREILGVYQVYESTGFRQEATHLSGVILRFAAGDQVELLERTNQYWWKVRFRGKTGWVKATKLQQDWF